MENLERIKEIDKEIKILEKEKKEILEVVNLDKAVVQYNRYLNTYSGQRLLSEHSLSEEGLWEVRGEDPNCDLGGSHIMPYLKTYEGKLKDVIMKGVMLSGFWQWGSGGKFIKKDVIKLY